MASQLIQHTTPFCVCVRSSKWEWNTETMKELSNNILLLRQNWWKMFLFSWCEKSQALLLDSSFLHWVLLLANDQCNNWTFCTHIHPHTHSFIVASVKNYLDMTGREQDKKWTRTTLNMRSQDRNMRSVWLLFMILMIIMKSLVLQSD